MATDVTDNKPRSTAPVRSSADIVRAILAPLASLKLTVALLVLAVIVTYIATLEQTRADVYDVKLRHFQNAFVYVPFKVLFAPKWQWSAGFQNVKYGFIVPSGITILVLMLINLTAAHILRFRLRAKGTKLAIGSLVGLFAAFVTWIVVFNGQNANGFQAKPPFSWTTMRTIMQIGIAGVTIGLAIGSFVIGGKRSIERLLFAGGALLGIGLLTLTIFLQDLFDGSAMRILWQLTQATVAATVSHAACMLLFQRKAGIVLLHLGIGGLLFNEIYVTATNNEQRMRIFEGETVSHAFDVRSTEMVVVNTSDPEFDEIISVPGRQLQSKQLISDDALPFDIRCVEYFVNSNIVPSRNAPIEPRATAGLGTQISVMEIPAVAGTDSNQSIDLASAFVELVDKQTGESLGVYLISQILEESSWDTVTVDETSYRIALRFETEYKPYSLTLVDAQREYYIGTNTPKWYSSDVVLDDHQNDIKSDQKIWMNNPLRYADETFYQSGMDSIDGREFTVLQVVRNRGWMIPYVCCMYTVVGLLAQFGTSMLGFLRKEIPPKNDEPSAVETKKQSAATRTKRTSDSSRRLSAAPQVSRHWSVWLPTILLAGTLGIWAVGELAKAGFGSVKHEKMRLDLLGQVPITIGGRVQPLDAFARNTARQLRKREFIADGANEKQPAIRWLADTMFEVDGYEDYRAFRIEDLTVLNALELPTSLPASRGSFLYTFAEIERSRQKLRQLVPDPNQKDPQTWSKFEEKLSNVARKYQKLGAIRLIMGTPASPDIGILQRLNAIEQIHESSLVPFVVPSQEQEQAWSPFIAANAQAWFAELAKEGNVETTSELAEYIATEKIIPPMREEMIRERAVERFLSDPAVIERVADQYGNGGREALKQRMLDDWDQLPSDLTDAMTRSQELLVDARLAGQISRLTALVESTIIKTNGSAGQLKPTSKWVDLLAKLKPAYQNQDAQTFNSVLEEYLSDVADVESVKNASLSIEGFYNRLSPFYVAMVLYIGGLVAALLSWLGWFPAWNRASKGLILTGLSFHILGIILRIVISGRPPVTNLYSSALFVSAVMVVLMLIVERFTKLGVGNVASSGGAFLALLWAWTMSIQDGDTFSVMVAVLDTQFWLATHVVIISFGYAATFAAGIMGMNYLIAGILSSRRICTTFVALGILTQLIDLFWYVQANGWTFHLAIRNGGWVGGLTTVFGLHFLYGPKLAKSFANKETRRTYINVMYGIVCFGLLCSFFGTVLGGLWGDDSWGRFWGWDPKENGALMIVLWNAVVLHARWGGIARERGLAALAALGNIIVLWSWKGVNELGVGLHAYAETQDKTIVAILWLAGIHAVIAATVLLPSKWGSAASPPSEKAVA